MVWSRTGHYIIPPRQKEPGGQRAGNFEEQNPRLSEDLEHEDKKMVIAMSVHMNSKFDKY